MPLTVEIEKISRCAQKILQKRPVKRDSSVDKLKGLKTEHFKNELNAGDSLAQGLAVEISSLCHEGAFLARISALCQ